MLIPRVFEYHMQANMSANDYNRGYHLLPRPVFNHFVQTRSDRDRFQKIPPSQPHIKTNSDKPGGHPPAKANNDPKHHLWRPDRFNSRHPYRNGHPHRHTGGLPELSFAHAPLISLRYPFNIIHDRPRGNLSSGVRPPPASAASQKKKNGQGGRSLSNNRRPGHLPSSSSSSWQQAPPLRNHYYDGPRHYKGVPYRSGSGYDGDGDGDDGDDANGGAYASGPAPIPRFRPALVVGHAPSEAPQQQEQTQPTTTEKGMDEILASHRGPPDAYIIDRPLPKYSLPWLAPRLWRWCARMWFLLVLAPLRAAWQLLLDQPLVRGTLATTCMVLATSLLWCVRALALGHAGIQVVVVSVAPFLWGQFGPWIWWAIVRGAVMWWVVCVGCNVGARCQWWWCQAGNDGTVYASYYYVLRKTPLFLGSVSKMVMHTGHGQVSEVTMTVELIMQAARESTSASTLLGRAAADVAAQVVTAVGDATATAVTAIAAASSASSGLTSVGNATNSSSSMFSATIFTPETFYAWLGGRNEGCAGSSSSSSAVSWEAVTGMWEACMPAASSATG